MAYAYGIDNDFSFLNKVKYSTIGHNILCNTSKLAGLKGYKRDTENKFVNFFLNTLLIEQVV